MLHHTQLLLQWKSPAVEGIRSPDDSWSTDGVGDTGVLRDCLWEGACRVCSVITCYYNITASSQCTAACVVPFCLKAMRYSMESLVPCSSNNNNIVRHLRSPGR